MDSAFGDILLKFSIAGLFWWGFGLMYASFLKWIQGVDLPADIIKIGTALAVGTVFLVVSLAAVCHMMRWDPNIVLVILSVAFMIACMLVGGFMQKRWEEIF